MDLPDLEGSIKHIFLPPEWSSRDSKDPSSWLQLSALANVGKTLVVTSVLLPSAVNANQTNWGVCAAYLRSDAPVRCSAKMLMCFCEWKLFCVCLRLGNFHVFKGVMVEKPSVSEKSWRYQGSQHLRPWKAGCLKIVLWKGLYVLSLLRASPLWAVKWEYPSFLSVSRVERLKTLFTIPWIFDPSFLFLLPSSWQVAPLKL